jgi:8-oxo-dGTP diphosphatase
MTPAQRTIRVVAAVLDRDGKYLITQRRASAVLPMMWEFPGGRVEAGETDAQALKREVMHRLGGEIECGKLISFVSHPYEHYVVDLFLYECRLLNGVLEPRAVNDFKWVAMNKLLGVG